MVRALQRGLKREFFKANVGRDNFKDRVSKRKSFTERVEKIKIELWRGKFEREL